MTMHGLKLDEFIAVIHLLGASTASPQELLRIQVG